MNTCQWLYLLEPGQEEVWGHEAIALAEVARSGVPVLPSFVIARDAIAAYFLQPQLKKSLVKAAKSIPSDRPELFAGAAKEIRQLIQKNPLPQKVQLIFDMFLQELETQVLVKPGAGLRLTVTELSPHGHTLTATVRSVEEGEQLIRKLLALSFTEHALFERIGKRVVVGKTYPILVQYHEEASISGTAYIYDFDRHDDSTITIQAHYHEQPHHARLTAVDEYKVDRGSLLMLSKTIGQHQWAVKKTGKHHTPAKKGSGLALLSDAQVQMLAKMLKRAQSLFTDSYCFHWLYAHNQLFVSNVELFTKEIESAQRGGAAEKIERTMPAPLVMGLPGNLGAVTGPVKIVHTKAALKGGEIVVAEQLKPGDHRWLAGAAALITETGHHASFEAQLAKQLGIPAVIGVGTAVPHFKDGQLLTVDGTNGAVYAGKVAVGGEYKPEHAPTLPVTGTKVLAAVLDPTTVSREDLQHSDGIGLLRSEFILRMVGVHPEDIVKKKLQHEYVEVLAEGIEQAARAVYPKPVVYQLHDMQTAHLLGWRERHHDRHEPNPTLGYRGTHRLLKEPEVLELELQALAAAMANGLHNIEIMLPMVRSLDEVKAMVAHLEKSAVSKYGQVAVWIKCETPALAIRSDELSELPIRGVCFDVPALSELIVGLDKDNYQVSHHLDHSDEAVLTALEFAITTCRMQGIRTTVVAELEGLKAEVIETAVRSGVTGVCVAPAEVESVHGLIASVEQRMMLDHILDDAPQA